MTKTGWIVAIIVIIVLIGGFLLWSNSASAPAVDTGASTPVPTDTNATPTTGGTDTSMNTGSGTNVNVNANTNTSVTTGTAPMSATVTYDGTTFSPASVTIAKGGTVTFTDTAGSMWLASNPHPAHTGYDGTSRTTHCAAGYTGPKPLDECASGTSFSFTFGKTGSFGYHDHLNSNAHGTVIVQ